MNIRLNPVYFAAMFASLQFNNGNNISSNLKSINCSLSEGFSQIYSPTIYYIMLNNSGEYAYFDECNHYNQLISRYAMTCDLFGNWWIKEKTFHPADNNNNVCHNKSNIKYHLCFDRDHVLQSCKGETGLNGFEISVLCVSLLSITSLCIILIMICFVVKYKNKKKLSSEKTIKYDNCTNDQNINAISNYNTIDLTYFDDNYEIPLQLKEKALDIIVSNFHVLNIEENLVENPWYEQTLMEEA